MKKEYDAWLFYRDAMAVFVDFGYF